MHILFLASDATYNSSIQIAKNLRKAFDVQYHLACTGDTLTGIALHPVPEKCIVDGIWYTQEELLELQGNYPDTQFIIRVPGKEFFPAAGDQVSSWIKTYLDKNGKAILTTDSLFYSNELKGLGITIVYLPIPSGKRALRRWFEFLFPVES